jgi:chromosome segregation ATPase
MTDEPGERPEPSDADLQSLVRTVEKLRILEEANAHTIKLIAEGHGATLDSHSAKLDSHSAKLDSHSAKLDSHSAKLDSHSAKLDSHSQKLDQIIQALAPLEQIRDFVERVSDEHEGRITALEKHTGIPR